MSPASGFEQFHHVNQAAQVRHSQGDSLEKVHCLSAHRCSTVYHASEHRHSGDCCVLDEPCCRRGDFCAAGRHRGALAAFAICRRQLKVSNSISEESEEKPIMRKALVVALSLAMFCTACSTAWVSTLDSILAAAAPALINILQIVAVAKGQPINSNLSAKINADATVIKTLAADFAKATSGSAPGVCQQLQAAVSAYQADQQIVLQAAQVSDANTQTKITLLADLVAGTVNAITAVIPSCQNAAAARSMKTTRPLRHLRLRGSLQQHPGD